MTTNRKAQKISSNAPRRSDHNDTESVSAYIVSLEHPLKSVIQAIRRAILEADRTITEGIKWNSPSFYCYGWFAAVNIRAKNGVQVILHHGAKVRDDSTLSLTINDASQLLTWLSKDRATITFVSAEDFQSKHGAFKRVVKQWAAYQAHLATL